MSSDRILMNEYYRFTPISVYAVNILGSQICALPLKVKVSRNRPSWP